MEAAANGARPRLRSPDVASAVIGFVRGSAGARFESLEVLCAETTDGRSATVGLAAYWRPLVVTLLVPEGFRTEVTAVARSVFDWRAAVHERTNTRTHERTNTRTLERTNARQSGPPTTGRYVLSRVRSATTVLST